MIAQASPPERSPEHQPVSPARHADWRWRTVENFIATRKRLGRRDAPWITDAVRFLRCLDSEGDDHAARRWPDIHQAHCTHFHEPMRRREIEALLLAGASSETIASKQHISAGAVRKYEVLFFDVDDPIVWLRDELARPAVRPVDEALTLKILGVIGGEGILDLVIRDYFDPLDHFFARRELVRRARMIVSHFAAGQSSHPPIARLIKQWNRITTSGEYDSAGLNEQLNALHFSFRDVLGGLVLVPASSRSKPLKISRPYKTPSEHAVKSGGDTQQATAPPVFASTGQPAESPSGPERPAGLNC
jgi:hypothetical protein